MGHIAAPKSKHLDQNCLQSRCGERERGSLRDRKKKHGGWYKCVREKKFWVVGWWWMKVKVADLERGETDFSVCCDLCVADMVCGVILI
jgi:hypothetical protein